MNFGRIPSSDDSSTPSSDGRRRVELQIRDAASQPRSLEGTQLYSTGPCTMDVQWPPLHHANYSACHPLCMHLTNATHRRPKGIDLTLCDLPCALLCHCFEGSLAPCAHLTSSGLWQVAKPHSAAWRHGWFGAKPRLITGLIWESSLGIIFDDRGRAWGIRDCDDIVIMTIMTTGIALQWQAWQAIGPRNRLKPVYKAETGFSLFNVPSTGMRQAVLGC